MANKKQVTSKDVKLLWGVSAQCAICRCHLWNENGYIIGEHAHIRGETQVLPVLMKSILKIK
ncbi:hypothetical protein MY539_01640 [Haemophilus influenzae]